MPGQNNLSCSAPAFGKLSAEVLRMGKSIRFEARGTSMQPILRDGDILVVAPLAAGWAKLGDVVLCQVTDEKLFIHRVIQRRTAGEGIQYLVKGDHVPAPDAWISGDQVYGRVVSAERDNFHINMNNPILKLLGYSSIVCYHVEKRWGKSPFKHLQFFKQLPIFYRYLVQEEFNG